MTLKSIILLALTVTLLNAQNHSSSIGREYEWPESINHLFDHQRLMSKQILSSIAHIKIDCKSMLHTYIQQLTNQSLWAIKMNDASGRYGGQFFFGNEYWLGSYDLCMELQENNLDHIPFRLHFFVIKLQFNLKISQRRSLSIGFCLPNSCDVNDLKLLFNYRLESYNKEQKNTHIQLSKIRPIPGTYNIYDDVKFRTIGTIALFMFIIIIFASIFETNANKKVKLHKTLQKSIDPIAIIENNNNDVVVANDENLYSAYRNDKEIDHCHEFHHIKNNRNKYYKYRVEKFSKRSIISEIICCFSAISNAKKILQIDRINNDTVTCIHGMRVLSLFWIIMVHTYLELHAIAGNKTLRTVAERYFLYQTVSNATFSVDSFFFISGFLVSLLYFRAVGKRSKDSESSCNSNLKIIDESKFYSFLKGTVKFAKLIIYRFFRLTPVYMFVICIQEISMSYYHNQSVFEPTFFDHINCKKYWWRNILYINNLFPQKEICMLWSWYISNDTQFYVVSIILLLVASRSIKYSKILILVLLIGSWITTFSIAYRFNYRVRIEEPFALFDQLYAKPWTRIGCYLVGVSFGYYLHKIDSKLKISTLKSLSLWICSLASMAFLVYGVGRSGIQLPSSAFYVAFGHTIWALSVGWITIACSTGNGKLINSMLSFRIYLPLSRLTYCAYLVHPMLMCITSLRMTGPLQLESTMVIVIYLGNIVLSFAVAFLMSLLFEAPILRLLKLIFGKNDSINK